MNNVLAITNVLFLGLGLGACASITSLQTAKNLKAGESSKTVAFGYSNLKLNTDSPTDSAQVPNFDFAYRQGITDKDEIGARLSSGVYASVDYKRSLIADGSFYLSTGIGLGGTQFTVTSGGNEQSTTILDFYIPLYADYWVSESFGLFVAPKYIPRVTFGSGGSSGGHLLGASGGFKWGQSIGLIAEVGYARELSGGGQNLWQVMGGLVF
jgi:hypothetical protein